MSSLWGEEFTVESTQDRAKKLLDKVGSPKSVKKNDKLSIEERLISIKQNVEKTLGHYADSTIVIKSEDEFNNYLDKCIRSGIVALDTETNNSLDPLTCKLMGVCLYAPGIPAAYIPVNHRNRYTDERFDWQLNEDQIKKGIDRLSEVKLLFHNYKFDYEVMKCTCNCTIELYWDTQTAACILDENEFSHKLKDQYVMKIDPNEERYSIEHLFEGVEYAIVEPELFALYAATDSYKTYKLYEYQIKEFSKPENRSLLDLLFEVEFPVSKVVGEMELDGIAIDKEYCDRLSKKYHSILDDIDKRLKEELAKIQPQIDKWRMSKDANSYATRMVKGKEVRNKKTKNEQLENPPSFTSPMQLAILLYDVLKVPAVEKNNPRGTGEDILEKIDIPIVNVLMEYRTMSKLTNDFIDALPKLTSERDGKIHSNFKQLGTKTGRFSCTNPNLQQIPARNLEVRMMFCADEGKMLIGSDYSQQEPRCLTAFSRDDKLLDAYRNNRDLYATLGAGVYNNDYWDNMEHWEDGSDNIEGKKRRKKMKTLYLGMTYGMGPKLLSKNMNCSIDEANKIINDFHSGFPQVSTWMTQVEDRASQIGYVEDFWGRRRRLPDMLLPEFSFKADEKKSFNPLIGSKGSKANEELINKYKKLLENISFNEYDKIKKQADAEGLKIIKNGGFISRAKRQCVNAAIQGSAATMTKKAMIAIYNDELMKKYNFRLLIGVHDELIGQCDEQYAEEASERLTYLMKNCVPEMDVPLKCDPTVEKHWYEEEFVKNIVKEFKSGKEFETIVAEHPEVTEETLKSYLQEA